MLYSRLNRLPGTVVGVHPGNGGNTKGGEIDDAVFVGVSARGFECGSSDSYYDDV